MNLRFRKLNQYNCLIFLLIAQCHYVNAIGNPFKAVYNWLQKKKADYVNAKLVASIQESNSEGFFSNPVKSTGESFAEGASNIIINEKLPEGLNKLRDLTKEGEVGAEVLTNLTKPIIVTTNKIEHVTDKIYKHFKKSFSICVSALIFIMILWYCLKILTIYADRRIR